MFEQANYIIENRLADNWVRTLVDYDNVEFNPVRGVSFVRLQVEWVDAVVTSLGGRTKGEGYIDLSIFVPSNEGTTNAFQMADELAILFNRFMEGAIKFNVARTRRVGQQQEWFQVKVLVPFVYDQCYMPQLGYGGFCGYGN
ncbi:MAG: hypothetical protein DRJ03_02610 [Chloroflexi bacterium]|nr:MAG: hypothetical protein DRJ03_02610 [Chloroflexota bacterium]